MRIEHIAMYVNDLEAAKKFFETYFQAKFNTGYFNPMTNFKSYFLPFEDGYKVVSGSRTSGDSYYESCVIGIEGNLNEITI